MNTHPCTLRPSPPAPPPRCIARCAGLLEVACAALLYLVLVPTHSATAQATVLYDAARDFSTNTNRNGVWSYGWSFYPRDYEALRGYEGWGSVDGLDFWRMDSSLNAPGIYFNPTGDSVTNTAGTVVLKPRQLYLQPVRDVFSCLRFEAPTNGAYRFVVSFQGVDTRGTTSDVYITVKGRGLARMPLCKGLVNGFGPGTGPLFDLALNMPPGTVLDFLVGSRAYNDLSTATGISVQVLPATSVPPTLYSQPRSRTENAVTGSYTTWVVAVGVEPLTYQWFFDGRPIPGATRSELSVPQVQPADAGTYFVVVSRPYGTVTSSNAVLTVLTYPPKFESACERHCVSG